VPGVRGGLVVESLVEYVFEDCVLGGGGGR
jgi:hypothetical protein